MDKINVMDPDQLGRLTGDGTKMIGRLSMLRNQLMGFFDLAYVVKNIKEIIDESKHVKFFKERDRKFINIERPVFRFNVDWSSQESLDAHPPARSAQKVLQKIVSSGRTAKEVAELSKMRGGDRTELDAILTQMNTILSAEVIEPLLYRMSDGIEEYRKSKEATEKEDLDKVRAEFDDVFRAMPELENLTNLRYYFLTTMMRTGVDQDNPRLMVCEWIV